jgi:hypothetical protein
MTRSSRCARVGQWHRLRAGARRCRAMLDRGHDKTKDGTGRIVWTGINLYRDEADE